MPTIKARLGPKKKVKEKEKGKKRNVDARTLRLLHISQKSKSLTKTCKLTLPPKTLLGYEGTKDTEKLKDERSMGCVPA